MDVSIAEAATVIEAVDILMGAALEQRSAPQVLLIDIDLPDTGGLDLLRAMRQKTLHPQAIVMGPPGSIASAVEAMKKGAFDYITKPIDMERLKGMLETFRRVRAAEMRARPSILIVDDDPSLLLGLSELLKAWDVFEPAVASNGEEALAMLQQGSFNIVVTDLVMPKMSGLQLLEAIKRTHPQTQVIVLTAQGTIETAVEAVKAGAYDYLTKPLDVQRFRILLDKCVERVETSLLLARVTGPIFLSYAREL